MSLLLQNLANSNLGKNWHYISKKIFGQKFFIIKDMCEGAHLKSIKANLPVGKNFCRVSGDLSPERGIVSALVPCETWLITSQVGPKFSDHPFGETSFSDSTEAETPRKRVPRRPTKNCRGLDSARDFEIFSPPRKFFKVQNVKFFRATPSESPRSPASTLSETPRKRVPRKPSKNYRGPDSALIPWQSSQILAFHKQPDLSKMPFSTLAP